MVQVSLGVSVHGCDCPAEGGLEVRRRELMEFCCYGGGGSFPAEILAGIAAVLNWISSTLSARWGAAALDGSSLLNRGFCQHVLSLCWQPKPHSSCRCQLNALKEAVVDGTVEHCVFPP